MASGCDNYLGVVRPCETSAMGGATNGWQPPAPTPQAWRDGDDLVFRIGTPLPPICVFCGAMAVTGIRNAIQARGHPFGNLQVLSTRLPVCDDDRRRHRLVMTLLNVTVVALFVLVLLTGRLPGPLGLVSNALNPFGGTLPGVRAVFLALAVFVGLRLVRTLLYGSRGAPRPVRLRYDHSRGGFVWLHGADPRCLSQLPPVTPARDPGPSSL
jgi:hypothetical protein